MTNMKKHILTLAVAISSVFCASAADRYAYSLSVNQKDGTKVEFKFEEEPVATIEGTDLKITLYDDMRSVLFPITEVENLTINRSNPTGVNSIADENKVCFGLKREALDVEGLVAGVDVDIYASDGRHVAHAVCDADGAVSIDITSLGSGIFVVKAAKQSFKFIR